MIDLTPYIAKGFPGNLDGAIANVAVALPDGRLAEARELSGEYRDLAHSAYRPSLERSYRNVRPFVEATPWNTTTRPDVWRGGDLMDTIGICNYIIDGAQTVS